jgi:excisionase family DNA binding protein
MAGRIGGSNRMLSVVEVAEQLGVSKFTVYDSWRGWGLEAHRVGKHLRFRERDLEAWLDAHKAQ